MKIFTRRELWNDGISVYMAIERHNDKRLDVADPLTFTLQEPGAVAAPAFRLALEDAQRLMDELWGCGLRPSEGAGSAGAMKAVQEHLSDLRKLVFKPK